MNKIDLKAKHAGKSGTSPALFEKAGYSPRSAEAIVEIDTAMFKIRRALAKREMAASILDDLQSGIDLQQFDVIGAVSHWLPDTDPDEEVSVGTVAARLNIDPSRASRLVAELVELGYLRRAASQADSRRIVLELTEKGKALGTRFHDRKAEMLAIGLRDWTEEELVTFARLIDRYSRWNSRGLEPIAPEEAD